MTHSKEVQSVGRGSFYLRPVLYDLFCKQGGAGKGYERAGFRVIGVDIEPQPHYPFEFHQGDALAFLKNLLVKRKAAAFHASPPCQGYSNTQRIQKNEHPDLIGETRELLDATGKPYVIENVPGAPLRDPIELCGAMFPPLMVYRHRLFETSFPVPQPPHVPHTAVQVKMGRAPAPDEFIQPVGNFSDVDAGRAAMGMPWATREGLREAIPPAYTEWIGRYLLSHIQQGGQSSMNTLLSNSPKRTMEPSTNRGRDAVNVRPPVH